MKRWHVVYTRANCEEKAAHHLRNQNFETYLPRYRKTRRHARRVEEVLRPLFPRYLFVRLDLDAERWRVVHGTIGVSHMIGQGDSPTPVPESVIATITVREETQGIVRLDSPKFREGEPLRIECGPFAEQVGLFEKMADEKRVFLLLDLMGRQVRIKTPATNLVSA